MEIPFLDLSQFREPLNQLKYVSPYAFMMDGGVCMLKNGALMMTFQVEYPDLESSSAANIASVASLFNRTVMSLAANDGWALFFDVRRVKTLDYPAGNFDNHAAWLVDQRRAENFREFGEHYTSKYYISFVWQLPGEFEEKTAAFFFKDGKKVRGKHPAAKKRSLPGVQKECENFLDECHKAMG